MPHPPHSLQQALHTIRLMHLSFLGRKELRRSPVYPGMVSKHRKDLHSSTVLPLAPCGALFAPSVSTGSRFAFQISITRLGASQSDLLTLL